MQYTVMATHPRGFALVLVLVYFIKHSFSCYMYIYYIRITVYCNMASTHAEIGQFVPEISLI